MADTLGSSARVSAAVFASRVLGVARESLFVAVFGVNWLSDAYYIAFRIPNLLRDLFAEGALSSAFVPTFTDALAKDGRARAFALGNLVLTGVVLVTAVLTLLGIVFAEPFVATLSAGFRAGVELGPPNAEGAIASAERLRFATLLARVMMPVLTLVSVSAVFMGMLNAHRRYGAPAWAPALFNVTCLFAGVAIWMGGFDRPDGLLLWSAATTAAAGVQAFCQLPALRALGFRPQVALRGLARDPAVRRMLRLMGPAALGLAAIQLNILVNTHFASLVSAGAVTQLQTAFRLFYLPVGVFGVALAVVTSTQVAIEAARGDRAALAARTAEGGRAVVMLATASAVGLIVLAKPVITVLFEHLRFGRAQTEAVVPVLRAYMLGVLPYSLVKIYAPAFYALDRPRLPMLASLAAVAVNLGFNAATFRQLGAPGLALGTSLAAVVNFGILRLAFRRLAGPLPSTGRVRAALALLVANTVMGVVAWGIWTAGERLLAPDTGHLRGGGAALVLALSIAAGFATYVRVLRALGHPGGGELGRLPMRIVRKLFGAPGQ